MSDFNMKAFLLLVSTVSGTLAHIHRRDPPPELEKPVVDPNFYWDSLTPLLADLPSVPHTINVWKNDSIPVDCKHIMANQTVDGELLTTEEVEVFSVTYKDCDSGPWHFCRHPSALHSKEEMAEQMSKVPPRLRTRVHYTTSWGGDGVNEGRAHYLPGTGDIAMSGNSINETWVWIHESAHSYDDWFSNYGNDVWFSDGKNWTDAFDKDESVVSNYALSNQVENFADTLMAVLYDINFREEGGLHNITDSIPKWANMYMVIYDSMWKDLRAGGTCAGMSRFEDSEVIDKTDPDATGQPIRAFSGTLMEGNRQGGNRKATGANAEMNQSSASPTSSPSPTSHAAESHKPEATAVHTQARLHVLDLLVPSFMFEVVSGAIKNIR